MLSSIGLESKPILFSSVIPVLAQCLPMLNENKILCLFKASGDVLDGFVLTLEN